MSPVHPAKAYGLIRLTLLGSDIAVSDEQPLKAKSPIVSMPSGNDTAVSPVHSSNARACMLVTS